MRKATLIYLRTDSPNKIAESIDAFGFSKTMRMAKYVKFESKEPPLECFKDFLPEGATPIFLVTDLGLHSFEYKERTLTEYMPVTGRS